MVSSRRVHWTALLVVAFGICAIGCTTTARELYEVEAEWIDSRDSLHPTTVDFAFYDLISTKSFGVIAIGDELVLQIREGKPYVLLGWGTPLDPYPPHLAAAQLNPNTIAFAGTIDEQDVKKHGIDELFADSNALVTLRTRTGAIHYVAGPPRPIHTGAWAAIGLVGTASNELVAVLYTSTIDLRRPPNISQDMPRQLDLLYRFDGATWSEFPPMPGYSHVMLGTACNDEAGAWWVAGTAIEAAPSGAIAGKRGYVARFADGNWTEVTPPEPPTEHVAWTTYVVRCGKDAVWVVGEAIRHPERIASWLGDDAPFLYRLTSGAWQWIDLPPPRPNVDGSRPDRLALNAAVLDRDNHFWVTYSREPRDVTDPIYSFDGERWTTHELPKVPGVAWYSVRGIAFAADHGDGWAIANLERSVVNPAGHGILLRFHDGEWQLQNWTWPFWRQRGFGLIP
jgi:hypothetical protein